MALPNPKERYDEIFGHLPQQYQQNVVDYMEYLLQKTIKEAWDAIPETDEPLNEEEREALVRNREDRESMTLEELKRELGL